MTSGRKPIFSDELVLAIMRADSHAEAESIAIAHGMSATHGNKIWYRRERRSMYLALKHKVPDTWRQNLRLKRISRLVSSATEGTR